MKLFFLLLLLFEGWIPISKGQNVTSDSLKHLIEYIPRDTNDVKLLLVYSNRYSFSNTDTSLILAKKALALSRDLHFTSGEVEALNLGGEIFHFLGNYPNALNMQFEALRINREIKDPEGEAITLGFIGIVYNELGEYKQALQYLLKADKIYKQLPGIYRGSFILSTIGDSYDSLRIRDSALYYQRNSYEKFSEPFRHHLRSYILRHMGNIYTEIGKYDSALKFYNEAILNSRLSNDRINLSMAQRELADLYESVHQYDSSLYYAHQALNNAQGIRKLQMLQASSLLARLYNEARNSDSAFFYLNIAYGIKDSLYGPEKFRQLQLLMLEEHEREQTITQKAEQFRNKIKYNSLLSALGIFLLLAFILFRNNRQKQKTNKLLSEQKFKIEATLTELKSTQAQLIQSEKMASLGELTAGIAHEIQNPLNFMNNFSEVNTELIDEMEQEMDKGNLADAKTIAKDIKENERKINHHGKRADAIVKGMLQHSRSSNGVKELANINALADEYLRLAYHGLRAKDKSFNATMKTDFDPTNGNINIIQQDIGRVLLNLYNNAFYAVSEKAKELPEGYEPTISVSTKKLNGKVEIRVRDNGNGIPKKVLDKIFQPFFTTKPTGQGTGLGLSLSYEIVKVHGGEIRVDTREGEFTEFTILLNT